MARSRGGRDAALFRDGIEDLGEGPRDPGRARTSLDPVLEEGTSRLAVDAEYCGCPPKGSSTTMTLPKNASSSTCPGSGLDHRQIFRTPASTAAGVTSCGTSFAVLGLSRIAG